MGIIANYFCVKILKVYLIRVLRRTFQYGKYQFSNYGANIECFSNLIFTFRKIVGFVFRHFNQVGFAGV